MSFKPKPFQTRTKIVFCIKDEPVLDMIKKEFKGIKHCVSARAFGRHTAITLTVNKIVPVRLNEFVMLDGYLTQFETLNYL